MTPEGQDLQKQKIGAMKKDAVKAFNVAGVEAHKDTLSYGLEKILGMVIGKDLILGPEEEKFWLVMAATEYAAEVPKISSRQLHRLAGIWTWFFTIFRELLSIAIANSLLLSRSAAVTRLFVL